MIRQSFHAEPPVTRKVLTSHILVEQSYAVFLRRLIHTDHLQLPALVLNSVMAQPLSSYERPVKNNHLHPLPIGAIRKPNGLPTADRFGKEVSMTILRSLLSVTLVLGSLNVAQRSRAQ